MMVSPRLVADGKLIATNASRFKRFVAVAKSALLFIRLVIRRSIGIDRPPNLHQSIDPY